MSRTVGIIGLGLIGGSMAKGLSGSSNYRVVGYARRQSVCDKAVADGGVHEASTDLETVIRQSDIVVFALPPDTNGEVFKTCIPFFKDGALITDVSSTKRNFAAVVHAHIPAHAKFVSIHPMAGSEKGGYEMATPHLFAGCTWIVLNDTDPSWSEEGAQELAAMGAHLGSRVEYINMAEHDGFMAAVSHMPHLVAAMVAKVAGGDEQGDLRLSLAAGGFRDVTRVAGGLPSMWREIIGGNRLEVANALNALRREVDALEDMLQRDDEAALEQYLIEAKEIRDKFSNMS
ncbi:MAG: prephenate dehydrogenase/arogenate dehydrogenase family protein [Veillonella sp.]|uniref:prephenate dehydrogenase n=1 Tax=Veillonella sp. TaxID=1926307 RepID=UPI0025F9882F|nr:prephenate dehydrogenase/arogenate dehydrogenase family protein [Veillonella sp.]MBS4914274.1 prephenate dehydrogenase/arogenate dehydrogenase family protein [Veillonella sp.]